MIHGVFHGDLHGGNLFVLPDGRVGLLDFGITGRHGRAAAARLPAPARSAATMNDVHGPARRRCATSAPCPPTPTSTRSSATSASTGRRIDPTKLTAEEMVGEIQRA